jgi:hypothetical protein
VILLGRNVALCFVGAAKLVVFAGDRTPYCSYASRAMYESFYYIIASRGPQNACLRQGSITRMCVRYSQPEHRGGGGVCKLLNAAVGWWRWWCKQRLYFRHLGRYLSSTRVPWIIGGVESSARRKEAF